jgi:hypothetical protein
MVEADGVARGQKFRGSDGDWSRKRTRSGGARLAQRDPRQFGGATEPQREAGPQDAAPGAKSPYRGAGGREHGDVPLPELAGLADFLRAQGLEDEEDLIRGMQEHFGLGRLAISTRQRFEAAIMSDEK